MDLRRSSRPRPRSGMARPRSTLEKISKINRSRFKSPEATQIHRRPKTPTNVHNQSQELRNSRIELNDRQHPSSATASTIPGQRRQRKTAQGVINPSPSLPPKSSQARPKLRTQISNYPISKMPRLQLKPLHRTTRSLFRARKRSRNYVQVGA